MATEPNHTSGDGPVRIALIIGSTRSPRAGPQISRWVADNITHSMQAEQARTTSGISLHLVDLATWALPLFDEPAVPSQVTEVPAGYTHAHTRGWSAEIASYSAFVFVTPQYNWGYPAGLKNAIDYLFHEWKGKPAMVVSYGGRGGTKAG